MESLGRRFTEPLREIVDEVLERECDETVRPPSRHDDGLRYPIGDGSGVMSAMAAKTGDEMADERTDDGDRELVLDSAFMRMAQLGVRRGRLAVERLWRSSCASLSWSGVVSMVDKSVRT